MDKEFLQDNIDFYYSLYEDFAKQAIIQNDQKSLAFAIKSYCISETIKAVLMFYEYNSYDTFNMILDELVPTEHS